MYKRLPCVFLSCSERFKTQVARPLKQKLLDAGVYAVIVSDEPTPAGAADWDPDAKVDYFMSQAEAVVVLCTPDDRLNDGTVQTRANIVDEIRRARSRPALQNRTQVLKDRRVKLPSNINPTFDKLILSNPDKNFAAVLRQLEAWDIIARPMTPSPATIPAIDPVVSELLDGLDLGDSDEAERRVFRKLSDISDDQRRDLVEHLMDDFRNTNDQNVMHRISSLVESVARIDRTLIPLAFIKQLVADAAIPRRIAAAVMLWDWAASGGAGDLPLDLVARLARPSSEDWYVFAPALGCTKDLLLHRRSARILVDHLAHSGDVDDRREAARALRDVARIKPEALTSDMVNGLVGDRDTEVATLAKEAARLIAAVPEERKGNKYSLFGI